MPKLNQTKPAKSINPNPASVIDNFLNQTLKQAGFANMPPAYLVNYKKKLENLLMQKIGLEITKLLDKKGQADLIEFLKQFANQPPKPEEVFKFYNSRLPGFAGRIKKIMQDFQTEYIARAKKARKA